MRSVTIIGAGPAGLSAARVLVAGGLRDVLVLERNPVAGGLPRFCDHAGWGMLDLHRFWRGPRYARELVSRAAGAEIRTNTTVTALAPGGTLHVNMPDGPTVIESRAVLIATGIRETPRGPRLVSGTRPWGVTTTGAFQEMAQSHQVPFRRPVIIGTELVGFSAIMTARHAGIQPVAMIEANARITARKPGDLIARHLLGVPVLTDTRLAAISGVDRVEGVVVEHKGIRREIACDGVIFSGAFVPEAFLAAASGVAIDAGSGGPVIDNFYRCADPAYFAAGNLLRPVEHSGVAAREGMQAAKAILKALATGLPHPDTAIPVTVGGAMRYAYPQRLIPSDDRPLRLFGRARSPHQGRLRVLGDDAVIADRAITALPERRLAITIAPRDLAGRKAVSILLD
jgi:thioredoxin reductase